MTVLFLARKDEDKMEDQLFKSFKDEIEHEIQIKAVVLVPGKILIGVCFPDIPTENEFPHVTLMTCGWPQVYSNYVL